MKTILATAATLCLLFTPFARAIELHATRLAPSDLAITGELAGLAPGEVRYVSYADLRALPTTTLTLSEGFLKGPHQVTALFVSDFVKALPTTARADCVLATCNDGYASVYTGAFITQYRPFFALEIDGKGPDSWPIKGVTVYNPGPYVITVSPDLVPAAATYLDLGHKKPSGVVTVEIGNFAERYAGDYTGPWEHLSAKAIAGREIWINSCGSCHPGPGSGFSGTKSGRPFPVLVAYAAYAEPYFKKYVRDPKSLSPGAKMEPHPHYTDEQLDQLIAFITAGTAR